MNKLSITSTILTFIGAAGVVGTAIMAVKAKPKADKLLEEAKYEKKEPLTKIETVKAVVPAYLPSILIGASTIACIIGANLLNKKSQASLMSTYALLENSYKEYRNKVNDLYGEEADDEVKTSLVKDKYDEHDECDEYDEQDSDDVKLFFDFNTLEMFRAPMNKVIQKTTMEDGLECYIITSPISPSIDRFY